MTAPMVDLALELPRPEVLRSLGYPDGRDPAPRLSALIEDALAEARALLEARGVFIVLPAERALEAGLPLATHAAQLVLALVTIGPRLAERASARLAAGEPTRALVLDAAGSAAAEEAADRLGAHALGTVAASACAARAPLPRPAGEGPALERVSCRVSPGYGRWPLEAQAAVFRLLPHARLGVELLPTLLMVPRKSVSFAMWLGSDGRPLPGWSGCDHCLLERCLYRRDVAPRSGVPAAERA